MLDGAQAARVRGRSAGLTFMGRVSQTATETFCRQVRARSAEHREALRVLGPANLHGQAVAILRQELDSLIRVIYLLTIRDRGRRAQLVAAAVEGRPWKHERSRKRITDREMVEVAQNLHGWTEAVYRFGCAFVHLSSMHDYAERDPMSQITDEERALIVRYLRYYHGAPDDDNPSLASIVPLLPRVFKKIADNLECYIANLERDEDIEE